MVRSRIELKSDTSVKGIEKVVVKSKKVKLKIIKPSADVPQDTLWITNEPQMPIDTCKAVLLNYNDGEVNYEWKYSVEYEPPYEVPGIDFKHTYDDSSGAINADTTKYIKQFNSFIGGNIKIKVKALAPDSTYKDSVANSLILGENPEPEDARARISQLRSDIAIPLHCIMHWESSFKQFSGGYPLAGSPCDYGICQISYPESEEQIWDWHANLDRAIELYDEKVGSANRYVEQVRNGTDVYSDPINHPEWVRHLRPDGVDGFPNATNFTAEQLQTDIYQLYNGGHYYLWQPDDLENLDGPGQWIVNDVPNPSTGAARYQVHQNVVNGNPPW